MALVHLRDFVAGSLVSLFTLISPAWELSANILWLSILGLSLATANPIDSAESNFGNEQKQRVSRSIWPFTSETATEEPVTYPPQLAENNQWFGQGETVLPQGIDLNRYPVWKIHKYHGIDLHPVKLQPEITYPPELHAEVDPGYYPGSVSPPEFSHNGYQTGYQNFNAQAPVREAHSTGYPAAYSLPANQQENYQTGEFFSSSFAPGTNPFDIQTQQKYEVYVPPQPLTDFRSTAYQSGSVNFQGQGQLGQNQAVAGGEGQSQTSLDDEENVNLSFLDDLGGLAPFLPDPAAQKEETLQDVESSTSEQGFFENLFSRFRGETEKPEEAETEEPATSGGFLSSIFGLRSDTDVPEEEPPAPQPSRGVFSSLFYQQQTEKPAVVLPTTYYLPKTTGPYIAVKLPGNAAPSFAPAVGVSNIPFHQVPHVPFGHHEVPQISTPTLDSGYPYNSGYSEVRHSGYPGPAASPAYQPSVSYNLPTLKSPPSFTQNHGDYQKPDFQKDSLSATQGETLDQPRAEYVQSYDNGQTTNRFNGQQDSRHSQDSGLQQIQSTMTATKSQEHLPISYLKTTTSGNAGANQNQNQNSQEYQYQNSNMQTSNGQDNHDQTGESVSISAPQFSGGFVPSLTYSPSADASDQSKYKAVNQGTTNTGEIGHDNSGDTLTQNVGTSLVPPKEREPDQSSVPVYQTSISAFQISSDVQEPSRTYGLPPIKDANNFHETSANKDEGDRGFIQNLSALTSYGTPTNSYASEPFVSASSDTRRTAVAAPMTDEVNDGSNTNANKDVFPPTLAERLNLRKAGRVLRKVTKRMNSQVERNNWRRSTPERQAPTEEADRSVIIRSEKDSIPEVRAGRQFDGTKVIDGYSKVQHQQHQFVADTVTATKPANPGLQADQE